MKRELGIFERAQFIADRYSPFHIVAVLRLDGAPAPSSLRMSFGELQKRYPFLKTHLTDQNGRLYFENSDDGGISFRALIRLSEEHWVEVVESELSTRIDASAGPLFRCTYLFSESQPHAEIILAISHTIADAASTGHLLHELMKICASVSDGTPLSTFELPPAPPLESSFPPAFRGWRLSLHTLRYALAQIGDEVSYHIRTIGKQSPPFHKRPVHGRILPIQFPVELFETFAQRARREGMTLNSALNAALLLAVNRRLYHGKKLAMRTFSFADLRPYVQPPLPPEHLGLYISSLRFTINVNGDGDFWSLGRSLHKKIYVSLKSGDKFIVSAMSELLMKTLTKLDSIRLCASALNYNGVSVVQSNYGEIKILGIHGFVSPHPFGPEMASQAQLFNDQLFWDFAYLEEDMDRETAESIVWEIGRIMKAAVGGNDK